MKYLETSFGGLVLRNPFIVSSSGLTDTAEKNRKWEEAGAGAVVLKSLFEEEIEAEWASVQQESHAEEADYLQAYYQAHRLDNYLQLIARSKECCSIPVIASVNCFSLSHWTDFAVRMEEAGADALELNIMSLPSDLDYAYGSYEQRHIDILRQVKRTVGIPVIVKLGRNLTNPIPLISQLSANGASGVVLFNRMASLDIRLEPLALTHGSIWGHPSDLCEVLRWTGLASAQVPHIPIAASGGVADGEAMVKALLAGASAVELCTVLYRGGAPVIGEALDFLRTWMKKNGCKSLSQFRGQMNARRENALERFERVQFFKRFSNSSVSFT